MIWNFFPHPVFQQKWPLCQNVCISFNLLLLTSSDSPPHPSIHSPSLLLLHSWSHGRSSQPQIVHTDPSFLYGATPQLLMSCSPQTLWVWCSFFRLTVALRLEVPGQRYSLPVGPAGNVCFLYIRFKKGKTTNPNKMVHIWNQFDWIKIVKSTWLLGLTELFLAVFLEMKPLGKVVWRTNVLPVF